MKAQVLIGYPHGGSVDGWFTKSLLDLQRFEDRNPASEYDLADIRDMCGIYIVDNRNELVRTAQRLKVDWLLQLDADLTFNNTLLRILMRSAHPETRPFVSGLYANTVSVPEDNNAVNVVDMLFQSAPDGTYANIAPLSQTEPFEVPGAVGAGIILTHMSLFEKVAYPWFDTPYITPIGSDRLQFMNEDIYFSTLVRRQLSLPIWCDPLAFATHWKKVPISTSQLRELVTKAQMFKRELANAADMRSGDAGVDGR